MAYRVEPEVAELVRVASVDAGLSRTEWVVRAIRDGALLQFAVRDAELRRAGRLEERAARS